MLRRLCARRYNRANLIKITQTPPFIFRYVEFPARIMRHRSPRLKVVKVIKDFNDLKVVKVFNSAPRRKKTGAPFRGAPVCYRETIGYLASRHDFPTTTGGASGTKSFGTIGVENDMPADALRFTAS